MKVKCACDFSGILASQAGKLCMWSNSPVFTLESYNSHELYSLNLCTFRVAFLYPTQASIGPGYDSSS